MTTPTAPITTREAAEKVGTDARTLRIFLRASTDYEAVGSGSRYSFTAKDIPTLKTRFAKWSKDREAARVAKAEAKAAEAVADDTTEDEAKAS
jgi:hypothetical protein